MTSRALIFCSLAITCCPLALAGCDDGDAPGGMSMTDAQQSDAQPGDASSDAAPIDGALVDGSPLTDSALPADALPSDAAVEPEPRPRHVDLIRGDRFPRLIIEIDHVPGTLPDMAVFAQVIAVFDDILDKPGGIDVQIDGELVARGADYRWPFDEVSALERETYDLEVPADTIKIHMLWVDGKTEQDTDRGALLGQAWSNRNIVIYRDNIEEACDMAGGGFPLLGGQICDVAYLSVLTHEIGHVIGLVRAPIEMVEPHEDTDHPHHDLDPDCVMFYAYEGSAATSALGDRFLSGDESAPAFDAACLADIAAVRDR